MNYQKSGWAQQPRLPPPRFLDTTLLNFGPILKIAYNKGSLGWINTLIERDRMASGCSATENSRHLPPRIGTLLIPSDPYWIQALEAIMQTAQQMGDELVILQPVASIEELNAISPDDLVEQILAQNLDALICTLNATSIYKILADEGLPLISLAETAFRHPKCIAISSLYPAGWLAGQYIGQRLSGKGQTLCVSAGLEQILITPQSRLAGYQDAVETFPAIETVHIPAYWTYAQAYPAILAALGFGSAQD